MTVSEKSRWLILLVVSSALFLIVIDMTVLYTALPSLARDLGTSASEKLWIINQLWRTNYVVSTSSANFLRA